MLFSYLQQTQRFLGDAVQMEFNPGDLTAYVNTARSQIAAEGQCIRGLSALSSANNTQAYAFTAVGSLPAGTSGPINIRMITRAVSGGATLLTPRPWEWFNIYHIATTGVANGPPTVWAQLGQGESGTIFLSPTPDAIYALAIDAVYDPIDLTTDTQAEALPYPWTDAVPYYAAYLALMSVPGVGMKPEAEKMWDRYTEFAARARRFSTPSLLPEQNQQMGIVQPARVFNQPQQRTG